MAAVAEDRAERLAEPAATVSPEVTCGEIYERFQQDPDLFSVPVVRDGLPLGMVHRQDLVLRLADRFGRALYERKPVEQLMDAAPLIVDAEMGFDALSRLILSERPSALTTGFIVSKDGRYLGCGTAMSMLRLRVALSERAARELEQARGDAEAANRAKSNFLANMCHELRTPLNAIIGFSDMMQREVFGRLGSERYLEYAQDIDDSGGHLLNVINEILDLSKVEAGRMEIAIERLEIEGLVRTALRMVETQAARCGVTLEAEIHNTVRAVKADEQKIRQVLLNLLSNAIKFTPAGGSVRIEVRPCCGGFADISVIDTGIGMSDDDIQVAMEPFGQIESGLDRRFEGTGLGLPVSRKLMELQNGALELRSMPGDGTRAICLVPIDGVSDVTPPLAADIHEFCVEAMAQRIGVRVPPETEAPADVRKQATGR